MFNFFLGVLKLALAMFIVCLVFYLLATPADDRSIHWKQMTSEALGNIEDIAASGRGFLENTDEPPEEAEPSDHAPTGSTSLVKLLPPDFREELSLAVDNLRVVVVTERWRALENLQASVSHQPDHELAVVREAVSLAGLFNQEFWTVNGRRVHAEQLEVFLLDHVNEQLTRR